MPAAVNNRTITNLRKHIFDEMESPGITTITRSGVFAGVLINLGDVSPQMAKRFHAIVRGNPKHGVQMLIDTINVKSSK